MYKILNLLVLTLCLTGLVAANGDIYNSTSKPVVSKNVVEIEYSPSQKYVILADSTNQMELRDGVTYFPYKTVLYATASAFSAIAFSQDDTKLAVGFTSTTGDF